jgi:hypothetical protein
MFSDHSGMKLKINNNMIAEIIWKLNNTLLNNTWIKEEISKEVKYFELNKDENIASKFAECGQRNAKGKLTVLNAHNRKEDLKSINNFLP